MNTTEISTETAVFISASDFLNQWLGHRRVTRRVIEAFPEDQLFTFSIGGMRTFAGMVKEMVDVSGPGIKGIATKDWTNTGNWDHTIAPEDQTKAALLKLYDDSTEVIKTYWAQITEEDFQEKISAFGQYEDNAYSSILYFKDNEIHHRAQGTVYLRALGIEPPAFYDRS